VNGDEVLAGLAFMKKGGAFADGVNIYCGQHMARGGTPVFVSFDRKAVRLLTEQGIPALAPQ
jgi:hypothetical protein